MTEAIKCDKRSRGRETIGGGGLNTTKNGESGTHNRGESYCEVQKSIIRIGVKEKII